MLLNLRIKIPNIVITNYSIYYLLIYKLPEQGHVLICMFHYQYIPKINAKKQDDIEIRYKCINFILLIDK